MAKACVLSLCGGILGILLDSVTNLLSAKGQSLNTTGMIPKGDEGDQTSSIMDTCRGWPVMGMGGRNAPALTWAMGTIAVVTKAGGIAPLAESEGAEPMKCESCKRWAMALLAQDFMRVVIPTSADGNCRSHKNRYLFAGTVPKDFGCIHHETKEGQADE